MTKPLKSIDVPHLGMRVKFGRTRSVAHGLRMKASDYMLAAMPDPPASCDYTAKAKTSLSQVYLNDDLGDCVIACGMHLEGVATGNATGSPWLASRAQVVAQYGAIGGYVEGDPSTDQGCNEGVALSYWTEHGFPNGTKLLGSLSVDATNQKQVMQVMDLFENIVFGIELPDAWVNPFPSGSGFTWVDGTPDDNNGHCVLGVGYDVKKGVRISTWGMLGWIAWEAVAHLASGRNAAGGELHVGLTPDQISKGAALAPNGVAWADLIADFNSLGGHVSPPAPPPAPAPSGPVTLAQAQAWARNALAKQPFIMTRTQAEQVAAVGLAAHWPTSSS